MKRIFDKCNLFARLNFSPWRWRQHAPPKRWYPWYPSTTLHSVTIQKTSICNWFDLY